MDNCIVVVADGARRLILVAEPHMLRLLRPAMRVTTRAAAGKRAAISELARNHTHLTPSRLHQRLVADALIR